MDCIHKQTLRINQRDKKRSHSYRKKERNIEREGGGKRNCEEEKRLVVVSFIQLNVWFYVRCSLVVTLVGPLHSTTTPLIYLL